MEWLLITGIILLCLICTGGPFVLMRRVSKKRERLRSLRIPLINTEDHRLDAALRQAQGGFNVCEACGFDNFKRSAFCTLCGDEIKDATREVAPERRKQLRREERRKSLRQLLTLSFKEKQEERAAVHLLEQQATRLTRQRRARRRREWTRKLDVHNRMFWFRAAPCRPDMAEDAPTAPLFPGYVLDVHKKPVIVIPSQEVAPDLTAINIVTEGESNAKDEACQRVSVSETQHSSPRESESLHELEPRTAAERTRSLRNACEGMVYDLVEASVADPTRLPSIEASLTLAQQTRLVSLFQRDFPSKYASFVTSTAGLLVPADIAHLRLNVHRARVYQESVASFAVIHREHMRSVMRIKFLDENGVDAGGVHREWFALLIEHIVDPATGLFTCVDRTEQTYYINPHSHRILGEHHLMHFFATGRLLGRALLEGFATGFHFALPLLKIILGVPVSLHDLEFFDPETYKSMQWMLENDHVDQLGLDFTVSETVPGTSDIVTTELVRNGRHVAVTDANKREFLDRKFKHMLFESVSDQLYALLSGMYEVVPQHLIMLFDPEELDHVLCGSDEIDVDDWESHTLFSADLDEHPARRWFWEIVREMPNEYRRRLLLFATGSSRVPLAGFSALTSYDGRLCPFTLKGVKLVNDGYVVGHACFNRIDLPHHVARDDLKMVLYATLDTEQYGFTTD